MVRLMLEQIDHVNLVVRDLPAMIDFYRGVLGLAVTKEVTITGAWIDEVVGLSGVLADVVYLDPPQGPRIELIRYRTPAGPCPDGLGQSNTIGLRHFAFRVHDIEQMMDRLKTAGVSVLSGIQTVPDSQVQYAGGIRKRLIYFRDPEGNLLELCEYKKG